MAIQHRRGAFTNFDPTRMLPGEWAVVLSGDTGTLDGRAVYVCYAAGVVKRMATYEDLHNDIENIEQSIVDDLTNIVEVAAQEAYDAASDAGNYGLRIAELEDWAFDHDSKMRDLDEMEECCDEVQATLASYALSLAALSATWLYCMGALVAPTAAAFSVSGTTATIPSTVSGETLTIS